MKNVLVLLFTVLMTTAQAQKPREILYVGTFTVRGSEGIYVYEFDRQQGSFNLIQTVSGLESPSFVALHPTGKFLYSVNRGSVENTKGGSASAYSIDQATGKLSLLNHKPVYGNGPCHVSIDQTGKLAFISNYNEGNFTVLRITEDGSLGTCTDSVRFSGQSIVKGRQDKPHVHSATVSADNRFVIVADLGSDKVYSFAFDPATGRLKPAAKPFVEVKPGSGPRHFTFHPKGKYAYLAEELSSTVAAFRYNKKDGSLDLIQDQAASLPKDFSGTNSSADIHTDASGKYLMMSNRGHNSLAVYKINTDGTVIYKESVSTKGEVPRNFLVDEKNEYVFVAHQNTDNIVVFKWDASKGQLQETGVQIKVPAPVCLRMLQLRK
jgi:6-phosphogluconolactonase